MGVKGRKASVRYYASKGGYFTHFEGKNIRLFVLKIGLPWEDLPSELQCGCGMSCWRRLHAWQLDGTWNKIHAIMLEKLRDAGKLDWSKCAIDSSSIRAVFGGTIPDRTPRIAARMVANTI